MLEGTPVLLLLEACRPIAPSQPRTEKGKGWAGGERQEIRSLPMKQISNDNICPCGEAFEEVPSEPQNKVLNLLRQLARCRGVSRVNPKAKPLPASLLRNSTPGVARGGFVKPQG